MTWPTPAPSIVQCSLPPWFGVIHYQSGGRKKVAQPRFFVSEIYGPICSPLCSKSKLCSGPKSQLLVFLLTSISPLMRYGCHSKQHPQSDCQGKYAQEFELIQLIVFLAGVKCIFKWYVIKEICQNVRFIRYTIFIAKMWRCKALFLFLSLFSSLRHNTS